MRTGIIILFFLLSGINIQGKDLNQLVSCHFQNISFPAFCDSIYHYSGVKVFYHETWVKQIKVSIDADSISIELAMKLALIGTNLKVSVWNHNIVILPDEELLKNLPDYNTFSDNTDTITKKEKNITESEELYLKGRKAEALKTIRIGKNGIQKSNSKVKIFGKIIDQETGEPVIGATIYFPDLETGAITDPNGYLTLFIKPGKYIGRLDCLGYEKKEYSFEINSESSFHIEMKKAVISMQEVLVYGDKQINIKLKDPGLEKISVISIKQIPMMMGERDILRVSVMLPGIVSVGEGSSGINVRGGNSDQNAFYINKIPIYNTSHVFGFFPAFNSDIIKDFSIYKGHIPAQYGGRLSSVFNIISRQGNKKQFSMHGGINPVSTSLSIEGPIIKDKCSFLLSGRTLYSDWILSRIKDPTIRTSSASFNDFSGSLNYDGEKSQTSLFVYNSQDYFRLSDINEYEYSNLGASVDFHYSFTNSLRGEFALIGSQYKFKTIDKQELSAAYKQDYRIDHYEFKADITQIFNEKHTFEYGINSILYKLDRGSVLPFGIQSLKMPVELGTEQGVEGSVYICDVYKIHPLLNLNLGLRYSAYSPIGPKLNYTYFPGAPIDIRNINDSIYHRANQPIRWYHAPEIRAAINYETDINGSIKIAFNQMQQNIFMLNNTITVAPNSQWKLADYHISPSKSTQFSIGVFRNLPKGGFEASVEFYFKNTRNAPEFKDGVDFKSTPLTETLVLQGKQKAYGIEFFLKRSRKKIEGWISYTYSRSMIQVDGGQYWSRINEGEVYPSNYDIPHIVNSVINFHLNRRITFSSVFTYQSGRPVTYPVSIYYINDVPYIDYSARNKYRIPNYFRTDLSLTFEGNLKRNKFVHSSWMFSVYNLTGRSNPYSVYFKNVNGTIRSYKYSVIGVQLFTATWIFKLGNYAAD